MWFWSLNLAVAGDRGSFLLVFPSILWFHFVTNPFSKGKFVTVVLCSFLPVVRLISSLIIPFLFKHFSDVIFRRFPIFSFHSVSLSDGERCLYRWVQRQACWTCVRSSPNRSNRLSTHARFPKHFCTVSSWPRSTPPRERNTAIWWM